MANKHIKHMHNFFMQGLHDAFELLVVSYLLKVVVS